MKRAWLVVLIMTLTAFAATHAQTPASSPTPVKESSTPAKEKDDDTITTFKVNVRLVNVFVTVTDASGAPVANLQRGDFQVLEDGYPQQISVFSKESELPLSIVLAVDASLSTKKDIKTELDSARRFVHAILRPVDRLSLYQFTEDVDELIHFTNDPRKIDTAIDRVQVGAATAMYDAIYLGADSLLDRTGRKVMVLITDGGDTVSHADYHSALKRAQEAEAILYSIIVVPVESDAGRNTGGEHALIQLSEDTGGKYYYASDAASMEKAFNQISQELRMQYLIGYYPSRRFSDSDFRRIDIHLNGSGSTSGYHVRHRTGYYNAKAK